MTRIPQRAFAGGILSEGMYARTDIGKWQQGLKDAVNTTLRAEGGIINRAGTTLAGGYDNDTVDGYQFLIPFEATAALATYSDQIMIILNLSVKDLRNARLLLEALSKAEIAAPVHLFANRCKGAGKPISLKEAQETLEFDGELRPFLDDPIAATAALHAGEPLNKAAAGSKLRKQIQAFARELRGEESEAVKKPRLGKRNKKAA